MKAYLICLAAWVPSGGRKRTRRRDAGPRVPLRYSSPARLGSQTSQIRAAQPGSAASQAPAGTSVDEVSLLEQVRRQDTAEGMLVASPRGSEKSLDPAQPQEAGTRSQLLPSLDEGRNHSVPLGLTVSSLFCLSLPLSPLLFTCFLTNTPFYTSEFTVA